VAIYGRYKLRLLTGETSDGYNIIVYKNNKVHQKFKGEQIDPITVYEPLFVGDIDGNGKVDLKIVLYNNGGGLAGSL
jgi:hypothetical protein